MGAKAGFALGEGGFAVVTGEWSDSQETSRTRQLVDVAVSYDVLSHLTVTVGADNVFNSYPDQATFQASRGLIYSRNSPYSTDGGLYYVRLNARF